MILDRKHTGLQRVAFLVLNWLFEHVMMDKDTSKAIRRHWVKDPLANMIRITRLVNLSKKKWSLPKSLKPITFYGYKEAYWQGVPNDWQFTTKVAVDVQVFGCPIYNIIFYR